MCVSAQLWLPWRPWTVAVMVWWLTEWRTIWIVMGRTWEVVMNGELICFSFKTYLWLVLCLNCCYCFSLLSDLLLFLAAASNRTFKIPQIFRIATETTFDHFLKTTGREEEEEEGQNTGQKLEIHFKTSSACYWKFPWPQQDQLRRQ